MPKKPSSNPQDTGEKLTFLPAIPNPYVLDVPTRLAQLREILADEKWAFQRANVLKAISMYERGELQLSGYQEVWFKNGEVIRGPPGKLKEGDTCWTEGRGYQY